MNGRTYRQHFDMASRWARMATPRTRHASRRMQQRSIQRQLVELVLDYGCTEHCGNGCTRYSFNKRSWQHVEKTLGVEAKALARARDIYVVLSSDGAIVTTAHRW